MANELATTIPRLSLDAWNRAHPPGTPVLVHRDDGSFYRTRTRSMAWLTGNGEPLVKVDGIVGGYSVRRVIPLAPHPVRITDTLGFRTVSYVAYTEDDCECESDRSAFRECRRTGEVVQMGGICAQPLEA
jgi:hypothetical protein